MWNSKVVHKGSHDLLKKTSKGLCTKLRSTIERENVIDDHEDNWVISPIAAKKRDKFSQIFKFSTVSKPNSVNNGNKTVSKSDQTTATR